MIFLSLLFFFQQSPLPDFLLQQTKAQFQSSYQESLDEAIHNLLQEQDQPSHKSQFLSNLDISSPEKLPTQNLYLRILNSFTKELKPSIYEGVSIVSNLTPAEVESILEYNNLAPIQNQSNLSQVQDTFNNIQELYLQEKDFFTQLAKVRQQAVIYEIFSDNNSQNSGFDLMTDLSQIEQKLFSQSSNSSINYQTPGRSNFWSNFNSQPYISNFSPVNLTTFSNFSSNQNNSTPTTNSPTPTSNQPSSPGNPTQVTLEPIPEYQFPTIQYGAVCQFDSNLQQELEIYQTNNSTEALEQDSINSQTPTSNFSINSETDSQSSNQTPSQQIANYQSSDFSLPFTGISQSCPPDQIFCFTRELRYNQVDLKYPAQEDCVSCLINRLNQDLQNLLDNGVLPQKITGNFGEPALCKKASVGKIGLNLNIFSKPILPEVPTPDYITDLDPYQTQDNSINQNSVSNSGFSIKNDTQTNRDLNLLAQSNAQQFIDQFDQNLNRSYSSNSQVNQSIQNQEIHFQELTSQMNTLNLYLESFNTSLDQLDQNFTELINLPECSEL